MISKIENKNAPPEIISPHCESCFNKNRETFLAGGPRSTVRDRAETLFYHGPRSHSLTRCRQFYGRQFALFSSSKVNFHDVTLGHSNKNCLILFLEKNTVFRNNYFVRCLILKFFDTYLSNTTQLHIFQSHLAILLSFNVKLKLKLSREVEGLLTKRYCDIIRVLVIL